VNHRWTFSYDFPSSGMLTPAPRVSYPVERAVRNRPLWPIAISLFLVLTTAAPGQQLPGQPSGETKFTLSGTVVNSATGQPIVRALVQLQGVPPRSRFTDSDGHFELEGLTAGRYLITAQKPGFHTGPSDTPVAVRVGSESAPVELKLSPYSVIYGRVTSPEGEPLEQVPVRLIQQNIENGRKRWAARMGGPGTDENGGYRFAGLMPGTYYLTAGPSAGNPTLRFGVASKGAVKSPTGYPILYYPNSPDISSASPIQLDAGQQIEAEFVLNQVPVYKITGVVAGMHPGEPRGLQVYLPLGGDMLNFPSTFSSDSGKFEIDGIPSGSYILKTESYSPPGQDLQAQLPITVTGDVNNVRIALEPPASIPVTVKKEERVTSSEKNRGGDQDRFGNVFPVSVHLSAVNTSNPDAYSRIGVTGNGRAMTLENVQPGRYIAEITAQDGWYVASAEYAGTNLLIDEMTVRSGSSTPIQVVLRDDGASLTGTVKTPDGAVGIVVVLVSQRSTKAPPRKAPCLPTGGFNFTGIPPGDYMVFAVDHVDDLEYANPDAMQPYLSRAMHITLSSGQKGNASLSSIGAGESAQ